jgi:hypothetical protein
MIVLEIENREGSPVRVMPSDSTFNSRLGRSTSEVRVAMAQIGLRLFMQKSQQVCVAGTGTILQAISTIRRIDDNPVTTSP